MSGLAVRAELEKLGRTLEVEPDQLAFLESVPADRLRGLRVAIYEMLIRDDRELIRRLGWVASRVPLRLTAPLAERVGPLLAARMAADMPSTRATHMAAQMSPVFIADIAAHLDPKRTHDLIRRQTDERLVAVARELIARRDYITMSRFVEFFSDDAVLAILEAVEDEAVVLRIAYFMGTKNRLDHLFRLLPKERLERLLLRVEEEPDELLPALLSLLIHVSYGLKRELGDLAAALGDHVLTGYVRAAHEQGLWADILPVTATMSESARRQFANLPVLAEPAVQAKVIHAADDHGLWGMVLPLVSLMDDDANRQAVAEIIAGRKRATLENASGAALLGENWETLLDLVQRMPSSKQEEFAAIVRGFGEVDPDLSRRIAGRATALGFTV